MTVNAINLDAITEALSRKADIDLVNCTQDQMTTVSKEYFAGLSKPSSKYVNLTLPANGSTITAPADGYVYLNKSANGSNQYIGLRSRDNNLGSLTWILTTTGYAEVMLPVKKNEIVQLNYAASGNTNYFRFIYVEGEK